MAILSKELKKKVMITVSPQLYILAKKTNEPFSRLVETALKEYLDEKRKEHIRKNLLSRATDSDRDKIDLQIANDFAIVDSELSEKI